MWKREREEKNFKEKENWKYFTDGSLPLLKMNFSLISGNYSPRQFEFHPSREELIFGTVQGEVCVVKGYDNQCFKNSYHHDELVLDNESILPQNTPKVDIKSIGKFTRSPRGFSDAILGLCWFRQNSDKFVVGSSRGSLYCGTTIDNNHAVHRYEDYDKLTSVHLNCNDQYCLVSGYTNNAKIYDVETGNVVLNYENIHDHHINISRFATLTPTLFCTSSFDKSVKAWDIRMRPINPIYTLECNSGIVMICFSHDDAFILASASDNEINQYLTVDGTTHTKFQMPKTGLDGNFTRAYYSSSCTYIFTGACEEPNVSILCATTGNLINRIECYPNRKHKSLYVQSLRGHPRRDNNVCVLTNYKCLAERELIYVTIPTYNDKSYTGLRDVSDGSALSPISSNMAFPTVELTNIMRNMRRTVQEISDIDGKMQQKYIICSSRRCFVDISLLKSEYRDLNIGIRCYSDLYLCHLDIIISRSNKLLEMYQSISSTSDMMELIDPSLFNEYSLLDLSNYIPEHIAYLIPIVLDYLYVGEIAVDGIRLLCIVQYAKIKDLLISKDCVTAIVNDTSCWHESLLLLFLQTVSALYDFSKLLDLPQLNVIVDRILSQHISNDSVIDVIKIGRLYQRYTLVEAAFYYLKYHLEFVDNSLIENEIVEEVLEQRRQCSVNILWQSDLEQQSGDRWSLSSIRANPHDESNFVKLPLPKFYYHSTVLLNANIMLVIGGMSDTQINNPEFPYAYNISSREWSSINTKSFGNSHSIPSMLCNHCCVKLDPYSGIIICIGGAYIRDQRQQPIYLLDTKTLSWSIPVIENSAMYAWSEVVESPIESFRYSRHTVAVINPTPPIVKSNIANDNVISSAMFKADNSLSDNRRGLYATKDVAWVIIYGGYNETTRSISSNIHVLICAQNISNKIDESTNESFYTWRWCYPKVHNMDTRQGALDRARCDHAVTVVPLPDSQGGTRMVVFGGFGGSDTYGELNDVKSLNCKSLSNLYWEKVTIIPDPVNGLPCKRLCPSLEYVASGNVIVLYGGISENTHLNDVWLLRLEHATETLITFRWHLINVGYGVDAGGVDIPRLPRIYEYVCGVHPLPRSGGHTSVVLGDCIYYFGGTRDSDRISNSNVLVLQAGIDNNSFQWIQPITSCLAATSESLIVDYNLPDIHYDLRNMFHRIVDDSSVKEHRISFKVHDDTAIVSKEYKCLDTIAKFRSKFIAAMYNSTHFQKYLSNSVDIYEFDPVVVIGVLIYLHTDIVCIDSDHILPLVEFAELYGFDHLQKLCEGYLMRQVDTSNVCAILNWASNWSSLLTLKKICYAVLMRNMVDERVNSSIDDFETLLDEVKEEFYHYYRDFNHAYK